MHCRILVQHMESLALFKDSVVWHIASQYTCEMAMKSKVVSINTH